MLDSFRMTRSLYFKKIHHFLLKLIQDLKYEIFEGIFYRINLYSFDNYFGYDPETNATGQSSAARGIDFGNAPIPRTIQVMLRANF